MYHKETIQFDRKATDIYFNAGYDTLKEIASPGNSFIITDENLMTHYEAEFKPWRTIVIPAGESAKNLETIDDIARQLMALEADRSSVIIGIGGGVVTDITGFAASIYKRGVRFGFMPASILGMADAATGGKNGIDIGEYKNMIGLIRQPEFLFYNYGILKTLPQEEWINGFAEIIKHACIKDAELFDLLQQHAINDFKNDKSLLHQVIERNVLIKATVVQNDEAELGERMLLNFGHTFGHAIENTHKLPHGHAIAIGMIVACEISGQLCGFKETEKVKQLIAQYHLPTTINYKLQQVMRLIMADKKRFSNDVSYILLKQIGEAAIQKISVKDLNGLLQSITL